MENEQLQTSTKRRSYTLPSGWAMTELSDLTPNNKPIVYGIVQAGPHVENGVPYIKSTDLNADEIVLSDLQRTSLEIASKYQRSKVVPGDIVFSLRGNVGLPKIVPTNIDEANLTQGTARISVSELSHNLFVKYAIDSPLIRRRILEVIKGSTFKEITIDALRRLEIPLPPLSQQRKIATILSTWDEAIQTADQLLKAKQVRKRSLMKLLLTGQKRLSGFSGEWHEVKLGEVFQRVQRTNRPDVKAVLSISAKKGFVSQTEKFSRVIAGENLTNYTLLKKGEFAYNKGNSDLYPCGCIYKLDSYNEAAVPNVYFCFKGRGEVDEEFYKFYFQNRSLDRQLHQRINSGVRNDGLLNLNANEFFDVKIVYPPLDEQRAIATVLNAVDDEIKLATEEVKALKQQKWGLMQELLTGKTLVKVEEEHQLDLLKSIPV